MSDYRFYHCYQKPSSIVCYPAANEHTLPVQANCDVCNSRLLFVPTYVPKILDTLVLSYKYYQRVHIKKSASLKSPLD